MPTGLQPELRRASIVASLCPGRLPLRCWGTTFLRPQRLSATRQHGPNAFDKLLYGSAGTRTHRLAAKPLPHLSNGAPSALPAAGIDLEPLILGAAAPVLKICTLCCVGAACARQVRQAPPCHPCYRPLPNNRSHLLIGSNLENDAAAVSYLCLVLGRIEAEPLFHEHQADLASNDKQQIPLTDKQQILLLTRACDT